MHYFIRTLDEYFMVAVIQTQWEILKKELTKIDFFEELV